LLFTSLTALLAFFWWSGVLPWLKRSSARAAGDRSTGAPQQEAREPVRAAPTPRSRRAIRRLLITLSLLALFPVGVVFLHFLRPPATPLQQSSSMTAVAKWLPDPKGGGRVETSMTVANDTGSAMLIDQVGVTVYVESVMALTLVDESFAARSENDESRVLEREERAHIGPLVAGAMSASKPTKVHAWVRVHDAGGGGRRTLDAWVAVTPVTER
jgi:hypothetical protein